MYLVKKGAPPNQAHVGVPDHHYGEAVKAFVVQKEGCAVTERELIDHCRRSLARFKVPVAIEFRTELPRTIIGKVLRRALRDEADPVVPAGMQSSRKAM